MMICLTLSSYPVYNIDRGHAYSEIEKHIMELKNLNYPVFSIDRDHKYSEIQANIQDLKNLTGKRFTESSFINKKNFLVS